MSGAAVLGVLDALRRAGCRVWIGGGWGVDALVGRPTRPHRDLDLAIDATDEPAALSVLAGLGYRVETDWRPVRVELAGPGGCWVDLHPVVFAADGSGVQAGLDGGSFFYPAGCFVTGVVDGQVVPCLSVEQQLEFHRGYPLREVDRADLRHLTVLTDEAGA
jgi:lincosamide nucleotidyltransferase A/C/D/E